MQIDPYEELNLDSRMWPDASEELTVSSWKIDTSEELNVDSWMKPLEVNYWIKIAACEQWKLNGQYVQLNV
jgi:hypothetical protein